MLLDRIYRSIQGVQARAWLIWAIVLGVVSLAQLFIIVEAPTAEMSWEVRSGLFVSFSVFGLAAIASLVGYALKSRPVWRFPIVLVLAYWLLGFLHDWFSYFLPWLSPVVGLLQQSMSVLVALWLVWRARPSFPTLGPLGDAVVAGTPGIDESIETAVRRVINSDQFASALQTVLPKGDDDAKHGLDFIPFMLDTIQRRRMRYESAAQRWLGALVVTSTLLTGVVVAFGYAVVNDTSFGAARLLIRATELESEILSTSDLLIPNLRNNDAFNECCSQLLDAVSNMGPGLARGTPLAQAADAVDTLRSEESAKNLSAVVTALDIAIDSLSSAQDAESRRRVDVLRSASREILAFVDDRAVAIRSIPPLVERLDKFLAQSTAEIDQSENRTSELIKRLAIGIIVTSFFLAIVRYIASVYSSHIAEIRQTEQDDLAVRKLYVAIKCGSSNPEAMRSVLGALASGKVESAEAKGGSAADIKLDSGTTELLNELLTRFKSAASK